MLQGCLWEQETRVRHGVLREGETGNIVALLYKVSWFLPLDKILEHINLKEERYILAYDFRV